MANLCMKKVCLQFEVRAASRTEADKKRFTGHKILAHGERVSMKMISLTLLHHRLLAAVASVNSIGRVSKVTEHKGGVVLLACSGGPFRNSAEDGVLAVEILDLVAESHVKLGSVLVGLLLGRHG